MKVRMLIGENEEFDSRPEKPVPQAEIEFVSFPMTQNYNGDDPEHPDTVTLGTVEELHEWARQEYYRHEIVEITIPSGAFLDPEIAEEIRRSEIAAALERLSTVYDDPRTSILDTLEQARDLIERCWHDENVTVDEMDTVHTALGALISETRKVSIETP